MKVAKRECIYDVLVGLGVLILCVVLAVVAFRLLERSAYLVVGEGYLQVIRRTIAVFAPHQILTWCVVSPVYGLGTIWSNRWAFWAGLIVNLLYLIPSLIAPAPFGVAMHSVLSAYFALRLAGKLEPRSTTS